MRILTLLTDYGSKDHYVASLKGQIYSSDSNIQIVDIQSNVQ